MVCVGKAKDGELFRSMNSLTMVVDCDGVLTDGKLYMAASGEKLFKAFHSRDIRAIRELVARGVRVIIVSADDWEGGPIFAKRVGAEFFHVRNKRDVVQTLDITFAIGDDAWDVPLLKAARHGFVPANAHCSVRNLPNVHTLPLMAGEGLVAAALDFLLLEQLIEGGL